MFKYPETTQKLKSLLYNNLVNLFKKESEYPTAAVINFADRICEWKNSDKFYISNYELEKVISYTDRTYF
jgi:hypothetical protein